MLSWCSPRGLQRAGDSKVRCRVVPGSGRDESQRDRGRFAPLDQATHDLVNCAIAANQADSVAPGQVKRLCDSAGVARLLGNAYVEFCVRRNKDGPHLFENRQPTPLSTAGVDDEQEASVSHDRLSSSQINRYARSALVRPIPNASFRARSCCTQFWIACRGIAFFSPMTLTKASGTAGKGKSLPWSSRSRAS